MTPAFSSDEPFDVLIMGAGFAGLCQARHLQLKTPGLRIGLVDPKGTDADKRSFKVGESLVEVSAMFLYRELELHEYLIENHCPKYGLNFHWPKRPEKTDTIHDYHHIWTNGSPDLPSYQLNRAKFEADLLAMCIELGAVHIAGKVVDVTIRPGDELNGATVKTADGTVELSARHLVDAAGRKFLVGRKLDNLETEPEDLVGLDTGSAWLRVDGVDRSIFQEKRDQPNGCASHYYGTNHWFGHGHWCWMIPIETESRCLSIGVVHHKDYIDSKDINSKEKFLAFLEANHRILFELVSSGEVCDFKYLPTISHASKKMISEDRWYAIGEAANMFDPFYSTGLVLVSYNVELVTETIRALDAGEPDAEEKREAYDAFIVKASRVYNHIYDRHPEHLGDAAAMSWRIYMESTFWFGILVPMFAGKWHLELDFLKRFHGLAEYFFLGDDTVIGAYYDELSRSQKTGRNIGMMNYTRTDQFFFKFNPLRLWDDFRQNSKYDRRRLNVLLGARNSVFFLILLYAKLRVKNSGWLGLFEPRTAKHLVKLTGWLSYLAIGERVHRWEVRKRPNNRIFAERDAEFMERYRYEPRLMPWSVEPKKSETSPVNKPKPEEVAVG